GHYPTTVEPGQPGDVGIAAHNTFWLGFSAVRQGDQIILETATNEFTYMVTGTTIVAPDEVWVLYRPGGRTLTLTTCWPLWAGAAAAAAIRLLGLDADLNGLLGGASSAATGRGDWISPLASEKARVNQLLRRTTFGATASEMEGALSDGFNRTVDRLVETPHE